MMNPDLCTVIHTVIIPSKKHPIGIVLNRKCNYEDRCGENTNNSQGNEIWLSTLSVFTIVPPGMGMAGRGGGGGSRGGDASNGSFGGLGWADAINQSSKQVSTHQSLFAHKDTLYIYKMKLYNCSLWSRSSQQILVGLLGRAPVTIL